MDQTINEQVVQTDEEAKPVTLEITPLKTLPTWSSMKHTSASQLHRVLLRRHDVPPSTVLTQLQHLFHRIMVTAGFIVLP